MNFVVLPLQLCLLSQGISSWMELQLLVVKITWEVTEGMGEQRIPRGSGRCLSQGCKYPKLFQQVPQPLSTDSPLLLLSTCNPFLTSTLAKVSCNSRGCHTRSLPSELAAREESSQSVDTVLGVLLMHKLFQYLIDDAKSQPHTGDQE